MIVLSIQFLYKIINKTTVGSLTCPLYAFMLISSTARWLSKHFNESIIISPTVSRSYS